MREYFIICIYKTAYSGYTIRGRYLTHGVYLYSIFGRGGGGNTILYECKILRISTHYILYYTSYTIYICGRYTGKFIKRRAKTVGEGYGQGRTIICARRIRPTRFITYYYDYYYFSFFLPRKVRINKRDQKTKNKNKSQIENL